MKENFLIADFSKESPEFFYLWADLEKKFLEAKKVSNTKSIKNIFLSAFLKNPYGVIFILNSNDSATFLENWNEPRQDMTRLVEKGELDTFISEIAWKMYDRNRQSASENLKVQPSELLLAEMKICDFRLDGKRPISPVGHPGKTFSACALQTFVRRSVFEEIMRLLPKRAKIFGVFESGMASAIAVSRVAGQNNFLVAETRDDKTNIYLNNGKRICFADSFNWGLNNLDEITGEIFGTPQEISRLIVRAFANGEFSKDLEKMIIKKWSGEMTTLSRGLKDAGVRMKTKNIYLEMPLLEEGNYLQPDKLFSKILLLGGGEEALKYFGFMSCGKWSAGFPAAAAFIDNFFVPRLELDGDEHSQHAICLLNYFAKRRMRWMMP